MATQTRNKHSLRLLPQKPLMSDLRAQVFDTQEPRAGIRFAQGAFMGIALCLPIWGLAIWIVLRFK